MGVPVQVLQQSTTSKEFVRWKVYLRELPNEFNPLYYYLAAIKAEVLRGHAKNPNSVKIEDHLLKFTHTETEKSPVEIEGDLDEAKQRAMRRAQQSKSAWMAITGYKKN